MLKIRKKQVEALVNDLSETWKCDFCTSEISKCDFCRVLLRAYPEKVKDLSQDDLRNRIWHGIEKARGYGFKQRSNMERYVHLMFILDREDFDTAPETEWAGQILGWEDADEDIKMNALEKRVRDDKIRQIRSEWANEM